MDVDDAILIQVNLIERCRRKRLDLRMTFHSVASESLGGQAKRKSKQTTNHCEQA